MYFSTLSLTFHVDFNKFDTGIFGMELDLTGSKHEHGTLSFRFHHELIRELKISEFKSDGEYTNIVYDTIDINKEYCLGMSLCWAKNGWEILE